MTELVNIMKDMQKGRALTALGLSAAGSLVMSPSALQAFFPLRGTGDDTAAIQNALDAAHAAGGGVVDLGNYIWNVNNTLTIDSSTTSLIGANATVSWAGVTAALDVGLLITQRVAAENRGRNITQRVQGIRFRGSKNFAIQRGIYMNAPSNPNQETAQLAFYDVGVGGFVNDLEVGDNAYICKWYHCAFDDASNACVYRISAINNSESMAFFGCTFGNSAKCLQLMGPNQDYFFYGCSFDYPTTYMFFIQSGVCEFHGCHFEGPYLAAADMFQIQDDASVSFFGGAFALKGDNPRQTLFQCWGTNSGRFYFSGVHMAGLLFAAGGALYGKPECVKVDAPWGTYWGQRPGVSGGVIDTDATNSDLFYTTLSANAKLNNPSRPSAGRKLMWSIKQAASGGPYTLSFGDKFYWQGGSVPVMPTAANAVLVIEATYVPLEDKWFARLV